MYGYVTLIYKNYVGSPIDQKQINLLRIDYKSIFIIIQGKEYS